MKTIIRWVLCLAGVLLCAGHTCIAAEPEIQISATYALRQNSDPPRWVVSLRFLIVQDGKTNYARQILVVTNPAALKSATYQFTDTTKGSKIELTPVPDLKSGPFVSTMDLLPDTSLDPKDNYELTIPADSISLRLPGATDNVANKELKTTISGTSIQQNFQHQSTNSFENKISFMGGTPGGVSSIDITYRTTEFLNIEWLNIDFNTKADFSLSPADKTNFFNSITGGGNIWYPIPFNGQYSELGFHGKFESDQTFERIDGLLGAQYAILPNFAFTTWISRIFVKDAVDVPPLLIFGYDYAHNMKGDGSTGPVNTETADNRLTALLRWRLFIAKNYDLSALPALGGKYDIDFDFELKGVYDINAEKFLDQSWISLEFTPRTTSTIKPSVVFTWARGKAGPTFHEISALLAGMKVTF